ncbi:MAG TPA: 2-oxo-4-hydroxy-4-carboxy-5-ureidoimidazoline decarboxylase [Candidatus Limnocylindria bacterium]|jgi:2-oxo-4-hydroxy-4-carboxy--5-ureidoimidazoline (OHCU) decarboxylase|nr:2-oxo-4-hydroxy-4-carboxy-5-ureidoimidazoline decarboxylase [Candidatus Limnocylindria bacterium]
MGIARDDLELVFEQAPGLAARVQGQDAEAIVASARSALARMTAEERIAVLNAHPRIGADPASLSALSRREQGEDSEAATIRELARLNDAYERRFGFRFVVLVQGRPKSEIVPVIRRRLGRTRDEELATGIEEFLAIAKDRLARART